MLYLRESRALFSFTLTNQGFRSRDTSFGKSLLLPWRDLIRLVFWLTAAFVYPPFFFSFFSFNTLIVEKETIHYALLYGIAAFIATLCESEKRDVAKRTLLSLSQRSSAMTEQIDLLEGNASSVTALRTSTSLRDIEDFR